MSLPVTPLISVTVQCLRYDCTWERTSRSLGSRASLRRTLFWANVRYVLHLLNKHQLDGS